MRLVLLFLLLFTTRVLALDCTIYPGGCNIAAGTVTLANGIVQAGDCGCDWNATFNTNWQNIATNVPFKNSSTSQVFSAPISVSNQTTGAGNYVQIPANDTNLSGATACSSNAANTLKIDDTNEGASDQWSFCDGTRSAVLVNTSGTVTFPNATDTLVGKATTDTLTNKTFDTAGTGNVFKVSGVTVTGPQGSTGTKIAMATGSFTNGNVVKTDANGNLVDGGAGGGVSLAPYFIVPSLGNPFPGGLTTQAPGANVTLCSAFWARTSETIVYAGAVVRAYTTGTINVCVYDTTDNTRSFHITSTTPTANTAVGQAITPSSFTLVAGRKYEACVTASDAGTTFDALPASAMSLPKLKDSISVAETSTAGACPSPSGGFTGITNKAVPLVFLSTI